MKRLFVIGETENDHRFLRLREEAEKINLNIQMINAYKVTITADGVWNNGKLIAPSADSLFWFLSNSTVNHYLIQHYSNSSNTFLWPDKETLRFSDKFLTSQFFEKYKIRTPKTALINYKNADGAIDYVSGFPCVIKKNVGSIGKYVALMHSREEISTFIQNAFQSAQKNSCPANRIAFSLQEFIPEADGRDIRVLCLNNEIIGAIERKAENGDFKANISLGGSAKEIPVDKELEALCRKIMHEGKLFYAGIDFIKGKNGYLAIEINTSAQFQGFEKATRINVAEKILTALLSK